MYTDLNKVRRYIYIRNYSFNYTRMLLKGDLAYCSDIITLSYGINAK